MISRSVETASLNREQATWRHWYRTPGAHGSGGRLSGAVAPSQAFQFGGELGQMALGVHPPLCLGIRPLHRGVGPLRLGVGPLCLLLLGEQHLSLPRVKAQETLFVVAKPQRQLLAPDAPTGLWRHGPIGSLAPLPQSQQTPFGVGIQMFGHLQYQLIDRLLLLDLGPPL